MTTEAIQPASAKEIVVALSFNQQLNSLLCLAETTYLPVMLKTAARKLNGTLSTKLQLSIKKEDLVDNITVPFTTISELTPQAEKIIKDADFVKPVCLSLSLHWSLNDEITASCFFILLANGKISSHQGSVSKESWISNPMPIEELFEEELRNPRIINSHQNYI